MRRMARGAGWRVVAAVAVGFLAGAMASVTGVAAEEGHAARGAVEVLEVLGPVVRGARIAERESRMWAVEGTARCGAGNYFKVEVEVDAEAVASVGQGVMVLLRRENPPSVAVNLASGVDESSVVADHVDWASYRLAEARHMVYDAVGSGSGDGGAEVYFVSVYNSGDVAREVALWGMCESEAGNGAGAGRGRAVQAGGRPCHLECSGHGACGAENGMLGAGREERRDGTCLCDAGWTGRGCAVRLEDEVAIDAFGGSAGEGATWTLDFRLPRGGRAVYPLRIPDVAQGGVNLAVEMARHSGDPVLLVTKAYADYADDASPVSFDAGAHGGESLTVPRGDAREALNRVPGTLDVARFADAGGFAVAASVHRVNRPALGPGLYYVTVVDFAGDSARPRRLDDAVANLTLTVRASTVSGMCPLDCNGRGECVGGQCSCSQQYAGLACEKVVHALVAGVVIPAVVPAGEWMHLAFDPREHESVWGRNSMTGIVLKVSHCGGDLHAMVHGGAAATPSVFDAMFEVESTDIRGVCGENMSHRRGSLDVFVPIANTRALFFVGLHNTEYFGHGDADVVIEAIPQYDESKALPGIVMVCFALFVVLVCVCLIGKIHQCIMYRLQELMRQRRETARAEMVAHARVRSEPAGGPPKQPHQGISTAVLASLPVVIHCGSPASEGATEGSHSECCAVCLDDYADGDAILYMSPCAHAFHAACLVDWLAERTTCPVCRAEFYAVVVDDTVDDADRGAVALDACDEAVGNHPEAFRTPP